MAFVVVDGRFKLKSLLLNVAFKSEVVELTLQVRRAIRANYLLIEANLFREMTKFNLVGQAAVIRSSKGAARASLKNVPWIFFPILTASEPGWWASTADLEYYYRVYSSDPVCPSKPNSIFEQCLKAFARDPKL